METIFQAQLVLGYVAWLLCFGAYVWPRLSVMDRVAAQRAIVVDLILDYYHAIQLGLPAIAGELGAAYAIPIIYVPLLMITHVVAFYLLLPLAPKPRRAFPA